MSMRLAVLLVACLCGQAIAQDKYQAAVSANSAAALQDARRVWASGKPDAAAESMRELVRKEPNYFAAQYNLGLALADSGKTKEAIDALEKAAAIRQRENIRDATVYNSLGWAYTLDRRYEKAEAAFNEAKKNEELLSPASKAKLYNNLGWLYLNTGDVDRARSAFATASKDHGSAPASRSLATLNALEQKQRREAAAIRETK